MAKSLLSSPIYLQIPIIHVRIGNYMFGAYNKDAPGYSKYPNYIQSLEVKKINGKVNTYTLVINYPINEYSDPNYFEKVFSSVSESREIEFTYGDASMPNYMYKKESAMIIKVKSAFQLESSCIVYTVSAVSNATLALTGTYPFIAEGMHKPSTLIYDLLYKEKRFDLKDIFKGMISEELVTKQNLIPTNDIDVLVEAKDNISPLDYLMYLVSMMTSDGKTFYVITYEDDTSGELGGAYFRISEVNTQIQHPEAYMLNIGYPQANYVYNFSVDNDESYSIYYDYQTKIHPQDYVTRINQNGDYERVHAAVISSNTPAHDTNQNEITWWSKVTEYPIKASITIKGLLRPAILMSYVRLNIFMYGNKHINSGLYIITKQVDTISSDGYKTLLNLTRIAGDN